MTALATSPARIETKPRITPEIDLKSMLEVALLRLSRRFRFDVHSFDQGATIVADDLTLHVMEDDQDFTVIFEPFDSPHEPLHISTRANEIEAVLRELLAS